jgi:hypothetical protein
MRADNVERIIVDSMKRFIYVLMYRQKTKQLIQNVLNKMKAKIKENDQMRLN